MRYRRSAKASVNTLLVIAILASLGFNLLATRDLTRPNVEVLPDMVHSPATKSFAASPELPNGQALQSPAVGTIARRQLPLHFAATTQEAVRAGQELRNPVAADQKALDRGATVYSVFCRTCHGPEGLGDGPVTKRGVPPPPSLLADNAVQMKDGQMFHVLTYGQNNMPPYASQLSREDRWNVIAHVRSMQSRHTPSTQPAGAEKP